MKLQDAMREARIEARNNNIRIAVVHDPIGHREDWETEDEAYGYAPEGAWRMLYRFGTLITVVDGD